MGAKREYTAIFAIGAKLLGSFRGAMNAAQARLRGLSATARRVTMGIGKLAGAFSGLFAIFTTFLAANILGKIFSTALDEAVEAEERTRDLIDSLMQMDEIRKKGLPEAQKQLALIFQHNKALEAQGVLHKDVLDTMSVQLAMGRIPSKDIQDSVDVMQNLLIKTKGVRGATEEAAKAMGQKWVMAARKGTIKGMGLGIPVMTPEQAKAFKEMTFPERVHKLIELGKAVGNLNEQSRNTPVGRVQLFQNAIQDLAQDVGEELWPALADVADAWREALPELKPMLIGGLKVVLGLVRDLGKYVRKELIPWWRQFQKSERFKQIKGVLSWIHAHIKPIAITVGVIVAALAGLAVLAPLIGVITAIANPIGLIVVGILAVVAAVGLLYANWGKVQEMFPATAAVVEHFIEGFKVSFKAGFDFVIAIWKTLVALFTGDWQGVGDAWKKVWNDMGAIAEWWKTTLIAVAKAVGQAFKDYFLKVFEDIKSIWTWMKGFSWSGIKKMFAEGKDAATAYGEQVSTGQAGGAGGYGGAAAAVAPVGSAVAAAAHALPPEALAKVQAERADIVKELMRPEIRNLVSATLATESGTAEGQKDVLEAMVNRAAAQKRAGSYKGIENVIKGGFYGPYNRGETAAVMAKVGLVTTPPVAKLFAYFGVSSGGGLAAAAAAVWLSR